MSQNNGNNQDQKNQETGHYLNNFTSAVNELFGLGKKEDMEGTETMATEITGTDGAQKRTDAQSFGSRSALHVLPKNTALDINTIKETIIEDDAIIHGEFSATSNLNVAGCIKGNVNTEGDIIVTGKIYGNVKGNAIIVKDGLIEGNITVKTDITLLGGATVMGDIESENLVSEGKIKGNVKASDAVSLKHPSVFYGNIQAKTVNMEDGVILNGNIRVLADVPIDSIFHQALLMKKMDDEDFQENPDGPKFCR